jgi:regulator of sigma E protease
MHLLTVLLLSTGWIQTLEVFAALSILVLLHEFGHFFFARLFKTRVEKFYLFFDFLFPFPNLGKFSLFKKQVGDTLYGIGWFPLGGYVKIAGMVDESMDEEELAQPPKPDEYRSKPAWQRLFIMLGGIIVNLLVAAIAYMFIYGIWGEAYLPTKEAKYGIAADSLAERAGLRDGDFILGVNGKPVDRFNRILPELILDEAKSIEVLRDGQQLSIPVPKGTIRGIIKGKGQDREGTEFIQPRFPAVVAAISKGSAADKMGLRPGDSIVMTNGRPTAFFDQFEDAKRAAKGRPITLTVVRNKTQYAMLSGMVPETGTLGFQVENSYEHYFKVEKLRYPPMAAVGKGFSVMWNGFVGYGRQLKLMFTSKEVKLSESVGGLITFGKNAPRTFEWDSFLSYLAFISIILAFMNLLPIPGLDGGYVIFLLFEMISGRKVSDKVMERATTVGLVLLLALMLYANGLDIFRLFKK